MTAPTPYVLFPGTAREALGFYASVFGGELFLHTRAEFSRTDGDPEAIAHGMLTGPVDISGADAGDDGEEPVAVRGMMLSLLGTAEPETLRGWFDGLAQGGTVLDPLQRRPWGDWDGQVRDAFGLTWLIGFQQPES